MTDMVDYELGLSKKRKRRRARIKRRFKKGFKAVATGGLSVAAARAKKTKLGRKILRGAKAVASGGLSLALRKKKRKGIKAKVSGIAKPLALKTSLASFAKPSRVSSRARKVFSRVERKTAGDCACKDEMAKLVAAKLVAQLSPPLDSANKLLEKFDLQRRATYEHQKLMRDDEFRRKVLGYIASKARAGNKACKNAIYMLRRA